MYNQRVTTMPMVVAVVVWQTTITNIGVVALIFVDGTSNDGKTVRYPSRTMTIPPECKRTIYKYLSLQVNETILGEQN
jgi:hypothetical protein